MADLVSPVATLPDRSRTLRVWDISPAVDERSEVFSGDTAYSQQLHFSLSPGCPVNVNRITLSPHTGAHADAPLHYASGEAADRHACVASYQKHSAYRHRHAQRRSRHQSQPAEPKYGLRVLENMVFDDAPEGDDELIALPLKLTRADASPVRAILRELA